MSPVIVSFYLHKKSRSEKALLSGNTPWQLKYFINLAKNIDLTSAISFRMK
jgi:hypothetical protein